jgi:hypothetical protein
LSIAITEEHQELARVARAFLQDKQALRAARALLDTPEEKLCDFWKEMAELGWLGLHIREAYGGQGFGLPELLVVVEELGRVVAPGPFLPTALAAAVVEECGGEALRKRLLPGLTDGSIVGAVGLAGSLERTADGTLEGSAGLVLGAGLANVLLVPVGEDLIVVEPQRSGSSPRSPGRTRRFERPGRWRDAAPSSTAPPSRACACGAGRSRPSAPWRSAPGSARGMPRSAGSRRSVSAP